VENEHSSLLSVLIFGPIKQPAEVNAAADANFRSGLLSGDLLLLAV